MDKKGIVAPIERGYPWGEGFIETDLSHPPTHSLPGAGIEGEKDILLFYTGILDHFNNVLKIRNDRRILDT